MWAVGRWLGPCLIADSRPESRCHRPRRGCRRTHRAPFAERETWSWLVPVSRWWRSRCAVARWWPARAERILRNCHASV